ncbi:hypothetical protein L541_2657 [Bordetella hinzii CA90 BAL1384]|uniref:Uncharacterized protein n=1 Tax=Bordetella hinzii OH87 BAL007II TaxID=1331262 RepID=A0ABR4QVS8_9BORD|nr:hypothetical protein L544_2361 [Bordetella hinzii OH87 BAL007II]KCB30313.1 hypothetical protein L541_2657 [Bordetella hinzii CA90 BAL1384]KCB31647.1 hypothetical protein L543_2584 [Bordetella hinzii L60]KCB39483.1 hypothetical protein L539_2832 [Bordetella hinzii 5132]
MRKTGKTANTNRHSQQKARPGGQAFRMTAPFFPGRPGNHGAEN